MIEKPADIITAYMTDSQNKEVVIEHDGKDINAINYYTGNITNAMSFWQTTTSAGQNAIGMSSQTSPLAYNVDFAEYIHPSINDAWEQYCFYVDFMVTSKPSTISYKNDYFYIYVNFYWDENDPSQYIYYYRRFSAPIIDLSQRTTFYVLIPRTDANIDKIVNAWKVTINIVFMDGNTVQGSEVIKWAEGAPRVFFTSTSDFETKWTPAPNFKTLSRIDVDYTIDNDELLLGDFTLTESLCSQDNIKFGLCEAAHCEFKCVTNATPKPGDAITVTSKLPGSSQLSDANLYYINWSLRNVPRDVTLTNFDPFFQPNIFTQGIADWDSYIDLLGIRGKVVDIAFDLRLTFTNVTGTIPTYFKLVEQFYHDGAIEDIQSMSYYTVSDYYFSFAQCYDWKAINYNSKSLRRLDQIKLKFYDANKATYPIGNSHFTLRIEVKNLQVHIGKYPTTLPAYDPDALLPANRVLDQYIYAHNNAIPLGVFYIDSVEKNYRHNIIEKSIKAYDHMLLLEQNAADWYTSYMFGIDSDDWISNGFEFARQIFSSYINYVMDIGLDSKDNYFESQIASYTYSDITSSHLSDKYKTWTSSGLTFKIRYAEFTVNTPNTSHLYMVKCVNTNGVADEVIINNYIGSYKTAVDPLGRGVCTNGGVLVIETRDNGTTAGFCINRGDYFMLSPNCTSFTIYIAAQTKDGATVINHLVDDVTIYEVESAPRLVNGYLRLCYYNYGTKDIFACNSSITGRDVVRSLLEVCGCFFRLSRFNGLPEFVYPTKGGLYPSNTLFPADDLYPRSGTDGVYPMGRYLKTIAEDYEVLDYGKIQILKNAKSNDAVSVCEWQYVGADAENTYIIDDNIFYCADDMLYDYDNMPEVSQMLAGMFNVISNLGYIPNVTDAIGSPWLECGDRLGLLTYDGGFETFIFRRTLKGIQTLFDTYESTGDEKNEAIDNFGY